MNERIKLFIKIKGLKSIHFAENIGVNRATISHILSGRNKPSIDVLDKIINKFPELNANWLISGEGNMLKSEEESIRVVKKIKKIVVFYDDQSFEELKT